MFLLVLFPDITDIINFSFVLPHSSVVLPTPGQSLPRLEPFAVRLHLLEIICGRCHLAVASFGNHGYTLSLFQLIAIAAVVVLLNRACQPVLGELRGATYNG